jgi:hypothetical protein
MQVPRYVKLDIHKRHVMVAAVNTQQDITLAPQKIPISRFPRWIRANLRQGDQNRAGSHR